jgi:hypothetical protein
MFDADRHTLGPTSVLAFMPTGVPWTEAQYFPWTDVESARIMSRESMPQEAINAHAALFANKGLTDPNVILGWLSGPTGVPRSDLFVLIPIVHLGTSEQWMMLFQTKGAAAVEGDL